jgi:hypothetical protein
MQRFQSCTALGSLHRSKAGNSRAAWSSGCGHVLLHTIHPVHLMKQSSLVNISHHMTELLVLSLPLSLSAHHPLVEERTRTCITVAYCASISGKNAAAEASKVNNNNSYKGTKTNSTQCGDGRGLRERRERVERHTPASLYHLKSNFVIYLSIYLSKHLSIYISHRFAGGIVSLKRDVGAAGVLSSLYIVTGKLTNERR